MHSRENLLIREEEGIITITINRPEKLNALNRKTLEELLATFQEIQKNPSLRGVILTGAGEKAFVAGADIKELSALSAIQAKELSALGNQLGLVMESLGKPIVAAIQGFALGGGCELAMACTLRYAHPKAILGQPEVKLGVIPGFGGTQRLAKLIGVGRAAEYLLSGMNISAEEAYRMGLINKLTESPVEEAKKWLKQVSIQGPLAIALTLEALYQGAALPLSQGLALEEKLFGLAFSTQDAKEGLQAFLEKRPPQFRGN
ncbi:MAG: enoyl-CoA hydratase-related protein [Planctomycetota bacterium]